jgi:hypothetical protein
MDSVVHQPGGLLMSRQTVLAGAILTILALTPMIPAAGDYYTEEILGAWNKGDGHVKVHVDVGVATVKAEVMRGISAWKAGIGSYSLTPGRGALSYLSIDVTVLTPPGPNDCTASPGPGQWQQVYLSDLGVSVCVAPPAPDGTVPDVIVVDVGVALPGGASTPSGSHPMQETSFTTFASEVSKLTLRMASMSARQSFLPRQLGRSRTSITE